MRKIFESEIKDTDLCIDKDFIHEKRMFSARLNKDGFSKDNVKNAIEQATFERFFFHHRDDLIVSLKAYAEDYSALEGVYMSFSDKVYGVDTPNDIDMNESNAGAIIHSILVTLYTSTDLRDKETLVNTKYALYIKGDLKWIKRITQT